MSAEMVLKFPKQRKPKKRLTKRAVEALPPPPSPDGRPQQDWTRDSRVPRLAICCWSTGSKVWYWCGSIKRRAARIKLGDFPEISPEQAAKLAAKVSHDVAEGIDPREERRRQDPTLGEIFDRWLEGAKAHGKKTWHADQRTFNRHCKALKGRRLGEIRRSDIQALQTRMAKADAKIQANRVLALLSVLFEFALAEDWQGENPCRRVKRFRERSRDRFLSAEELRRLFSALEDEDAVVGDFVRLLLFTGQRRGKVLAMRWEEIDWESAEWRIEEQKNSDWQRIPLSEAALAILRERQEWAGDSPYVFPGRFSGHLSVPHRAWERVCKAAELKDVRLHDLRRTHGSWMAAAGCSLPMIGKALGHRSPSATAIYARLDIDPVRQAVEGITAAMVAAASGKEGN